MALSKEYSGIKLRTAFDPLTIFLFHFSSSLIDIVCGKCSIQLTQSVYTSNELVTYLDLMPNVLQPVDSVFNVLERSMGYLPLFQHIDPNGRFWG